MTKRETSGEIDAAATDWAVCIDSGPLNDQKKASFDAWLAGDTRRVGAYARARGALLSARRIKALGTNFDPDAYRLANVYGSDQPDVEIADDGVRLTRRRMIVMGGAAAAASAIGTVGLSWQAAAATTFSTKRGEIRLVSLDDGSSMTLNTDTTTRVHFDGSQRRIELVTGEVLFDAVWDATRPFIVNAGTVVVDVRTESAFFALQRLIDDPIKLIVRRGAVALLQRKSVGAASQYVPANTQVVALEPTGLLTTVIPAAEVDRSLAWREGMLSFEDVPLSQAASEFARYSNVTIRFENADIASQTVTGLFAANNPAGFAEAAAASLDLQADRVADGVVLRRQK